MLRTGHVPGIRRSHTPSVEFRIGGRRLAVVQDLRFVRDWICLLERISRTPSEPLHSELMFLSRLRRLWKYNHVLPPCAPPSRPKPQNILCFFPGSPRSQNILCFFSELYCCFPLAFFPFLSPFCPFFSPAFLLLPSLLPRVGKRCVQSGGKQLRACSRGHRRGCSSIDDFYGSTGGKGRVKTEEGERGNRGDVRKG